ncbi:CpaD family pilus assembly protein [Parvularcula oceani]|uniref:CpaD family pilus assembly protein n=1 Tax=Parvularcula oceani TaxID=1247963 RepID=UPI0004E1B10D|nr:CpaD family pilus assembly protein [Parvularcula oceani]
MRRLLLLALAGTTLSACASLMNTPEEAYSVEQRHPITVDQQVMTLVVPVDPQANGLSRTALAQIDRFVDAYRAKGYGPMTVTAPSGGAGDRDGQQTAADVRAALDAFGVSFEEMRGATVRRGGGDEVILSFSRYVASGPECGAYGGNLPARLAGRSSTNFGCATQANLAAMIADPRDLHQGHAPDGMGDDALSSAIEGRRAYRTPVVIYEAETKAQDE